MKGGITHRSDKLLLVACYFQLIVFIIFALATNTGSALAQQPTYPELNCNILLNAMKNRQVSEDFYSEICGSKPGVKVNNLFSTANVDQIIQSIATRSPSMIQQIKDYGAPERVIALLGQQSLDQRSSMLSSLNWRVYRNFVDYITSANIDYYIEEFLFSRPSSDRNTANSRFTTLFWIALRAEDPFFLKSVLNARGSPYKLEYDPSNSDTFPCAANIYWCVVSSTQTKPEEKQQILSTLESFKVNAPSWTRKAIWQEFSRYNFADTSVPDKEICDQAVSNDCQFVTSVLQQARIVSQGNDLDYQFTDYAGYDAIGKRHLFTGFTDGDVFAAWVPAVNGSNGLFANREIEVISHKVINGQVSEYKDQIGKRIQYFNRLHQTGYLAFDNIQSRYLIRVTQRKFY